MMGFMDAVDNMMSGKRMVRQGWGGFYVMILAGQSYIWNVANSSDPKINVSIYTPSVDDINATDWIVKIN